MRTGRSRTVEDAGPYKEKAEPLSRFFFDCARRKEKANKKKRRFVGLRAPRPRHLFEKRWTKTFPKKKIFV